jgi:hypothetical protein
MSNEIQTKDIEKPSPVIKQQQVTTEQLLEKLLKVEKLLAKIDQKLNTPLIS